MFKSIFNVLLLLNVVLLSSTYVHCIYVILSQGLSMVLSKSHVDVSHFDVNNSDDDDDDVKMMDTTPSSSSTPAAAQTSVVGDDAIRSALPNHRWLLEQLPSLSQFSTFRQQVCDALRKVVTVV